MSFSEYVVTSTKKMKLVLDLVPTELSKLKKFVIGIASDYGPTVKLTTNPKAAIKADRNTETQIKEKV